MIDIEELRHLAEKAASGPWYTGNGTYEGRNIYSVESVTDNEGFTYQPVIATVEDNDSPLWAENTTFIAAANPAAVSELIGRLEAAENERDTLRAELEALKKQEPVAEYIGFHPAMGHVCRIDVEIQPGSGLYLAAGAQKA